MSWSRHWPGDACEAGPQSGSWKSHNFGVESFWLAACPQIHFCFKDEIFGNRLAVGKCEVRVPCSALEIPQAHRDHRQLWQGRGRAVRGGQEASPWDSASPAPTSQWE